MENLPELHSGMLRGDMYVVVEQDMYPKSAKVKLSELRKWILSDVHSNNGGSTDEN